MKKPIIKRASLSEIRAMDERGELAHPPAEEPAESLGAEFWAKAEVEPARQQKRSVHLKLDPEVFEFFYRQGNGKGHLTKMQAVLRAYVKAHDARS